jgi:hypothetical protein
MRRVLFAALTVLVGCGCLCSGCMCPSSYGYKDWQEYRTAEVADRKAKAQLVIDALAKYKERHGRYPERLDDLVAEKLLDAIPNLAVNEDHQGKSGRVEKAGALQYAATADAFAVRLRFSFVQQAWTSNKDYVLDYESTTEQWRGALWTSRGLSAPTKK